MEEIRFLPTEKSPEVKLSPDGIIMIKGRGFILGNSEIPQKVSDWIDNYIDDPDEHTCVILSFEYINSFTTVTIISILRKLLKVITMNKKLVVQWYYEEGDHDILERGEHISSTVNIPFEFIKTG
jgi:hypothetical protein